MSQVELIRISVLQLTVHLVYLSVSYFTQLVIVITMDSSWLWDTAVPHMTAAIPVIVTHTVVSYVQRITAEEVCLLRQTRNV